MENKSITKEPILNNAIKTKKDMHKINTLAIKITY
jgi:hypothetical protein